MDQKRISFLNIPVDCLTMDETIAKIESAISSGKQIHHVVVNAAKIVSLQKDENLKNSIIECDIINADGQSIVWASHLLGTPIPERVTGIDLMSRLVEISHKKKYKLFLFGARQEVLDKLVHIYSTQYSPDLIVGSRNGYYVPEEEEEIADMIRNSKANILFVALTSPKKEVFLHNFKDHLQNINLIMGVGGSFDVIAGFTKRAPVFMQKAGFEWLYRLLQEPRRMWKRYLFGNSRFIFLILMAKLGIYK